MSLFTFSLVVVFFVVVTSNHVYVVVEIGTQGENFVFCDAPKFVRGWGLGRTDFIQFVICVPSFGGKGDTHDDMSCKNLSMICDICI
jgi:hypothetical protein